MFSKKNDTWLKAINSILILLCVLSLATAIGSQNSLNYCYDYNLDDDNLTRTEEEIKFEYQLQCELSYKLNEEKTTQNRYYGFSLFGSSIVAIVIINILNKKEK